MVQRRIGPVRGAGVAIIEQEGEKTVEPGALGYAGYAGILEKGEVGELIVALNRTQFLKKCGSYYPGTLLPDACLDYYNKARGAGGLLLVRVTDGNEAQAQITLYSRKLVQSAMGTVKAKNGGRWAGKKLQYTNDISAADKLTNTTLDTEISTFKTDEWAKGWVELDAVASKKYPIVSNTVAGVITVASNSTMKDDWTAASQPTNLRYYLYLENEQKALSIEVKDGIQSPTTEFGLNVYVDDELVLEYLDLSTDSESVRYWVNIINNDGNNDEIEVVDLLSGALVPADRPANYWGKISAVTTTVLTSVIHEFYPDTTGDGNGTLGLGTTDDLMSAQIITITFSSATNFTAASDIFGALGAGTVGSLFTPNNKWTPPFTLTAGGTAWEASDVATLVYKPFIADSLIDGYLYPDKPNASREKYRITDNDHKTITVALGSDLTASGAVDDEFMVVVPLELGGGRDGIADLADSDYEGQAWETGSSPFNRVVGRNLGLIKFATPGVTATAVQKAGVAYANAKNHQYRYEIPSATVTEVAADTYINDTLGRNDFAVVSFPSYAYVADPEGNGEGKLKLVSCVGMIHGAEARVALDHSGYHKAEAGEDVILPKILKLPTGEAVLDEEYLNPLGIGIIKKVKGNFVLWGDRTLYIDPTWKWKHQRELMSHYENVLIENFGWIVFAINDPETEKLALAALTTYFLPEWTKRAIRGNTFSEAAILKIDSEINTDATRAAGDMYAEISLKLADVVERFIMRISKQGVFESVET